MNIAILGSTRGSNMLAVAQALEEKRLNVRIALVVSNKKNAMILERAVSLGFKAMYLPVNGLTRAAYDEKLSAILEDHAIDLIVLIGYMRILSADFVKHWQQRIINTHPSLLPAYAGKMDLAVHEAVLADHQAISGCSIHYVTEALDAGPIILQKKCEVFKDDTAERLKQRVQALEAEALIETIQHLQAQGL